MTVSDKQWLIGVVSFTLLIGGCIAGAMLDQHYKHIERMAKCSEVKS